MRNRISQRFVSLALKCVIFASLLSATAIATAGEYDGLWVNNTIPGVTDVALVRHSGETIIIVFLALSGDDWDAFYGPISGSSATITTLLSGVDINARVNFTSATSMVITINSCTSTESCPPAGAVIPWGKIF